MTICIFDPPHFKPRFTVVALYLHHKEKFLLVLRHPAKPHGNTWSLPAGKVHEGEKLEEALGREVEEELSVRLPPSTFTKVGSSNIRQEQYDFVFVQFTAELQVLPKLTLKEDELIAWRWVTPAEALTLTLVPGEETCIRKRFNVL